MVDAIGQAGDAFDAAIAKELARGCRLKSRSHDEAVVVYGYGKVLTHLTFAALTFFANALFVFPWIVWANTGRERELTLRVDANGNIVRDR